MACGDYDELWEYLADFTGQHPLDAILCFYTEPIGLALFSMIVFGGAGLAMSIRTRAAMPTIVAFMFSATVIFAFVPDPAMRIGAALMFLALTVAGYILYQRSSSAL